MYFFSKITYSPFEARVQQMYQKVRPYSGRDSDESSSASDGLLGEKDVRSLRCQQSVWRRWYVTVVAHSMIFIIYLGILYYVDQRARIQGALRGPGLVYCEHPR